MEEEDREGVGECLNESPKMRGGGGGAENFLELIKTPIYIYKMDHKSKCKT